MAGRAGRQGDVERMKLELWKLAGGARLASTGAAPRACRSTVSARVAARVIARGSICEPGGHFENVRFDN